MLLQNLAKSPKASEINMTFTKHIINALMHAREEKLKREASIPRKLDDGWDPIIKMKVNDFDCNAFCYLGSSTSVMPKTFIICFIYHLWKIVIWMFISLIMLRRNLWEN